MATNTAKVTLPADNQVLITREFDAPPHLLWRALTEPELVKRLCLADAHLLALTQVALRCDEVFGPGPHDVEWAFEAGAPYLLQRRPVAAPRSSG